MESGKPRWWQKLILLFILGRHLHRQGVSVPKIYFHDTFSGLVFLQDSGDVHLQQMVQSKDDLTVIGLNKTVIQQLIKLSRNGATNSIGTGPIKHRNMIRI